jgi:hypothetical protein
MLALVGVQGIVVGERDAHEKAVARAQQAAEQMRGACDGLVSFLRLLDERCVRTLVAVET